MARCKYAARCYPLNQKDYCGGTPTAMTLHWARFTNMNSGTVGQRQNLPGPWTPTPVHICSCLIRCCHISPSPGDRSPDLLWTSAHWHPYTAPGALYPCAKFLAHHDPPNVAHRILTLPTHQPQQFPYFIISPHLSLRGRGRLGLFTESYNIGSLTVT